MAGTLDFRGIRAWRGSQDQAFEELCYQLRDPTPKGGELVKTGVPDAGLEWYSKHKNGVEWGWQAKYTFDIDTLLTLMAKSLKTVVAKRPQCRRLTFCIPFDLSDEPQGGERKAARQKFEDRKRSWRKNIPGAEKVRIDLWSEGELLERLNAHPAQRGISWFFWDKELFSPEWCSKRLGITIKAAGERYTPELHVDLPVAFSLEGLTPSDRFWDQYQEHRATVFKRAERVVGTKYTGLGVTPQIRELERSFKHWCDAVPEPVVPPNRLPRAAVLGQAERLEDACSQAFPELPPRRGEKMTRRQEQIGEQKSALYHRLNLLRQTLVGFEEFLRSPAAMAAEHGALLLTGDAGQGKTHLFCDAGARAIEQGQPAAVLLGGQFSARSPWTSIANQLGLGDVGSEELLGAMQAAGEASNAPFLFLIDALNEAGEPEAWRETLPAVLAEIEDYPWVSVALSIRSSFIPITLPDEGLEGTAEIDHPGFQGRELEATEMFFDHFKLQQPRIPLLTPEFTNPLFLKLYCEGLHGLGIEAPLDSDAHVEDVFGRYIEWKEKQISAKLKVDPSAHIVRKSLEAVSKAMVADGRDHLLYEDASKLVTDFAPSKTEWPTTLVGQLISEGILSVDVVWDSILSEYSRVIRFTYQRFADYQAVGVILEPFSSKNAFKKAVAPGSGLRSTILNAPAGWIEALSVQLPERLSIELFDAAGWRLNGRRRGMWDRALVRSVVTRRSDAVADRSRELMTRAQKRTRGLSKEVLDGLLTVAPQPSHPLNADFLHQRLMSFSLADRDVAWSKPTYFSFTDGGPLDRLIRWAARKPQSETPNQVIRLAAIPLIWTFTSPNRRLRDYATKTLVCVLSGRLAVLNELLESFKGVNDPYVAERLAVVAHGALLISGPDAPAATAVSVARTLKAMVLDDDQQIPNIVTRDAVRGAFEWCLRRELIDADEYYEVTPPYNSLPPSKPRTKKQLERAYERSREDRQGNYIRSSYAALFLSIFDFGDFGRYVVESDLREFTRYPLSAPIPKPRKRAPKLNKTKVAQFEATLTDKQKEALAGSAGQALGFVEDLKDEQQKALLELFDSSPPVDPRVEYPAELAQRWIFERVLSLGWDPDYFDEWEQTYVRERGDRSEHKTERFGKKYQWIALRELIARIADNFHMRKAYGEGSSAYVGPWQFLGRDIDPTLPPAPRTRDEDGNFALGETFPLDSLDSWWVPEGPSYRAEDEPVPDTWAAESSGIPDFQSLVKRKQSGKPWVVLQAYYNWDEERDKDGDFIAPKRRDLWSHIKSWLVPTRDAPALVRWLNEGTLMGNWMPEGREVIDAGYLREMPWAAASQEYPVEWVQIEPHRKRTPINARVYPSWTQYLWEGNVLDCSIENSVGAMLPSPLLFESGGLIEVAEDRGWQTPNGKLVAEYREAAGERHSALLVDEKWLKKQLEAQDLSLIVGWLGEKQLLDSNWISGGIIGSWTEINGIASLSRGHWEFGERRLEALDRRVA